MATTLIRAGIRRAATRSSIAFTSFRFQEPSSAYSLLIPSNKGHIEIVRRVHQNSKRKHDPKAEDSLLTTKQILSEWPQALGVLIAVTAIIWPFKSNDDKDSSKALTPSKSSAVVASKKKISRMASEEQRKQETYWEGIAIYERKKLDELLKQKNMKKDSYPKFTVGTKDLQVNITFQVPQSCALTLMARLAADLGLNLVDSEFTESNSSAIPSISLCRLETEKQAEGDLSTHISSCADIYNTEIEIRKPANFSSEELNAIGAALGLAGICVEQMKAPEKKFIEEEKSVKKSKLVGELESLGVTIYGLQPIAEDKKDQISWKTVAGYDQQKREIEDTILLALRNPELYDDIARSTRIEFESNRPRGLLFDGPPGTGKTSTARVIAGEAGIPLLHVPLEAIVAKYYGEAERNLAEIFRLAKKFPEGSIVFLDEIDSIASSRENNQLMHEVTRRVLSVLLRQIDGFTQDKKVIVIGATNRRHDLDPALLSRFDTLITFSLPDQLTRQNIAANYAKHLTTPELDKLAKHTDGMAGREIKDICIKAERHWASKVIREQVTADSEQRCRPPLQEYIDSAIDRKRAMENISYRRRIDQRL